MKLTCFTQDLIGSFRVDVSTKKETHKLTGGQTELMHAQRHDRHGAMT